MGSLTRAILLAIAVAAANVACFCSHAEATRPRSADADAAAHRCCAQQRHAASGDAPAAPSPGHDDDHTCAHCKGWVTIHGAKAPPSSSSAPEWTPFATTCLAHAVLNDVAL